MTTGDPWCEIHGQLPCRCWEKRTNEALKVPTYLNNYISKPNIGTRESLEYTIRENLPICVSAEFKFKKSRFVKPGTLVITITEPNHKPWWKFW